MSVPLECVICQPLVQQSTNGMHKMTSCKHLTQCTMVYGDILGSVSVMVRPTSVSRNVGGHRKVCFTIAFEPLELRVNTLLSRSINR